MSSGKRVPVVTTLLAILLTLSLTLSGPPNVYSDKTTYRPGETVIIRIEGVPYTTYAIEVRGPSGWSPLFKQLTTDSEGQASFKFILPIDESPPGTYTVYVASGLDYASITFEVEVSPSFPSPAWQPPAPAVTAASAISSVKYRLQMLLYVFFSLNQSLSLLGIQESLTNILRDIIEINATILEADFKLSTGDHAAAVDLASSASIRATQLLNTAFEISVKALRSYADNLRSVTNDTHVLSLLNSTDEILKEISPMHVNTSLRSIELVSKILLAARRLIDVTQLEIKAGKLAERVSELEKSLEAALNDVEKLRAKIDQLREENAQLRISLSEAEAALLAARKELVQLQNENLQLKVRNTELEQQSTAYSHINIIIFGLFVIGLASGFIGGYILRSKTLSGKNNR